jgi:hypothetical protein
MNIYEKLAQLQQEYKAPKNEYNSHGGFKYRSLEKMLEPLKPMLKRHKLILFFKDTLESCGETPHIVAHAILINEEAPDERVENTAAAQEAAIQKGMQAAQISGSTSSYARKYALAGLLLVDESEELDSKQGDQEDWEGSIKVAKNLNALVTLFNRMDANTKKQYTDLLAERKRELADASND